MSLFDRILGRKQPEGVVWPGRGIFKPAEHSTFVAYQGVAVEWMGSPVDFIPDGKTPEAVTASLVTADALLADQARWQADLEEVCLRDAYPVWRDGDLYREEDDPPLTASEWWAQVSLMFVAFDVDGEFEFMLYGGDGPLNGMKFVAHGNTATGFEYATD